MMHHANNWTVFFPDRVYIYTLASAIVVCYCFHLFLLEYLLKYEGGTVCHKITTQQKQNDTQRARQGGFDGVLFS